MKLTWNAKLSFVLAFAALVLMVWSGAIQNQQLNNPKSVKLMAGAALSAMVAFLLLMKGEIEE